MNERLVEDWLTKASERSFQTPFAQSLVSDGMAVLRVAHSPFEHGKDVIALDQRGKVHAYQLKEGNLDLDGLERIQPQLTALVETQVEHPGIKGKPRHQPWLVITGTSTPAAEDRIRAFNEAWKRRRFTPLCLISRAVLLVKFNGMAANFWPQQLEESRALLSLCLADGRGNLDRAAFSKLMANIVSSPHTKEVKAEIARRIAAANLFASYALGPFYSAENHWEAVQGWTMVAANIAWAADKAHLAQKVWRPSFRLAADAALAALDALATEALPDHALQPGTFHELDDLTRTRCTICAGAIAARVLIGKTAGAEWALENQARKKLEEICTKQRLVLWGESAVPFFLATMWALDALRPDNLSDKVLLSALSGLARTNRPLSRRKLPGPHESSDDSTVEALKSFCGEVPIPDANRAAVAFTLEPMVALAAGRLWRNVLAMIWADIANITIIRLMPDHSRDLLLWDWEHKRGREESRNFGRPQSWKALLDDVRKNEDASLPSVLLSEPDFAWLFLITHPHRLTRPAAKYFEALRKNIG